jgi:BMFP domain-containing protein YqiC
MAKESIDKLARTLAESVPAGLRSVREDLEQNFRAILKGGLDRLDLVTREEFDVQQDVLARTREKLAALERRLADLETKKPAGREESGDSKSGEEEGAFERDGQEESGEEKAGLTAG